MFKKYFLIIGLFFTSLFLFPTFSLADSIDISESGVLSVPLIYNFPDGPGTQFVLEGGTYTCTSVVGPMGVEFECDTPTNLAVGMTVGQNFDDTMNYEFDFASDRVRIRALSGTWTDWLSIDPDTSYDTYTSSTSGTSYFGVPSYVVGGGTPPVDDGFGTLVSGSALNSSVLGASTSAVSQASSVVPLGVGVLASASLGLFALRKFTLLAGLGR